MFVWSHRRFAIGDCGVIFYLEVIVIVVWITKSQQAVGLASEIMSNIHGSAIYLNKIHVGIIGVLEDVQVNV